MNAAGAYRDRTAAARAWRAGGGSVIGVFADDVPTALIEAAGFMPYRISGDPAGGQPAAMARGPIDVRADRLEFVNSWAHLIATGRYDFVDHFIVSNSRKYVLQLSERLAALDRPPSVHVLDRALDGGAEARAYNLRQIAKLRAALERWSGAPIERGALEQAVARRNALAAAMRRIAALREGESVRLSGLDALRLFGAARFLHSEHALPLLAEAITCAEQAPGIVGKRLFVSGSPLDQDRVYAEAEANGFIVVGESHRWGARSLEIAIGDGDPFDAVAAHYHTVPDFIVPLAASTAEVAARFLRSGAEASLAYVFEHDDASLWEAPSERAAMGVPGGVPGAFLAEQPYRFVEGHIAVALTPLVRETRT